MQERSKKNKREIERGGQKTSSVEQQTEHEQPGKPSKHQDVGKRKVRGDERRETPSN